MQAVKQTTSSVQQYTLIPSGDRFFQQLLTDFRLAKQSIDIEVYKFGSDFLARRVADALISARKRGVRVRLIVDAIGTMKLGSKQIKRMMRADIHVKIFHPTPWQLPYMPLACIDHKDTCHPWIRAWLNMNQRTHRKLFIIDEEAAYIGSMNINAKPISKRLGGLGWREFAIRFNRVHIDTLKHIFNTTWDGKASNRHDLTWQSLIKSPRLRLAVGKHMRLRNYRTLLRQIAKARDRVWLAQAYVVPLPSFIRAMVKAAKRGVDVVLIRPRRCDSWLSTVVAWIYYRTLLRHGVRIYEYADNMYHCKCLLIDNHAIVGSSNLNHRSLLHDLEIDIQVDSPEFIRQLEQQFEEDLKSSIAIEQWRGFKAGLIHFFGRLLKPFHYWL